MHKMILLLLLAFTLFACSPSDSQVVAQVNSEKLTMQELKSSFSPQQWKSLTAAQKKEYVQQWINMTLLAQQAKKDGIQKDKAVKQKLKYAQDKVLANALIAAGLANQKITEEDLFNYYRIHQGDFANSGMNYKVQRIFVTDAAQAERVKTEILNGMSFEDAARIYSQEALGQSGGFMGVVTLADADSSFYVAVQKLKQNELTTLTKPGGVYVLRYYAVEPGTKDTGFESVKEEIRRRILIERKQQVYDDLLKELKSKSDVYLMI